MATIRIKRSTGSTAPTTLANAELAFAEGDGSLYIGVGTGGVGGSASTIPKIASRSLFENQAANRVYASNGLAAAPSWRALVAADIPQTLSATFFNDDIDVDGVVFASGFTLDAGSTANLSAGSVSLGSSATATTPSTSDNSTKVATTAYVKAQGYVTTSGVTSVALSLPNIFNVSGSPVTSTGTLSATLASQTGGLVLASPTAGGTPLFRALVKTDCPSMTAYQDESNNFVTGTTQTFSGTINLANIIQVGGVAMTSTAAELNRLDGATAGTVVYSKAVVYSSAGVVAAEALSVQNVSITSDGLSDGTLLLDFSNRALCNGVDGNPELEFGQPGEVTVNGDLSVGNDASVSGHLVVGGNLTVNGSSTIVNSTQVTLDDPVITLGGDTAPTVDSNTDRGVEFRWHNGTAAKVGFFGFDDSTGRFTFIPDNTSATTHVYSGTLGAIDVGSIFVNGVSLRASTLSDGTTGSGSIVLATGPALAGTPTAPTAAADTNTTQIATTAFVIGQASSSNPIMAGTAAVGTSKKYARADHVHPTDTTRAPLASPALTGTPTAPTAAADTNTTQIATTAYVIGQGYLKSATAASSYQPLDAELTALAGLTSAADRLPYFTGSGTANVATFTSKARELLDDASASAMRTTLELGTLATQASSNVSITGGSITGATIDGGSWT
jgi:hypothetical protein